MFFNFLNDDKSYHSIDIEPSNINYLERHGEDKKIYFYNQRATETNKERVKADLDLPYLKLSDGTEILDLFSNKEHGFIKFETNEPTRRRVSTVSVNPALIQSIAAEVVELGSIKVYCTDIKFNNGEKISFHIEPEKFKAFTKAVEESKKSQGADKSKDELKSKYTGAGNNTYRGEGPGGRD